jgi:Glycosyl hydrolase family 81 C-terminal domain
MKNFPNSVYRSPQRVSDRRYGNMGVRLLVALAMLMVPVAAAGANIPVGAGSYKWGITGEAYQPRTLEPQPAGVKTQLVGAGGAIQTSDWWTSIIYKWSAQPSQVEMNRLTPGPLAVLSTTTGVACRQNYYAYNFLTPLNQGPALYPDIPYLDFREVWVGVGKSNAPFGVDAITYNAAGQPQPQVTAQEYGTWSLTYDTLYQGQPGSANAPRLRATFARGCPYLWVEYPDGFPGQTADDYYPMLQAIQDGSGDTPRPIWYLPPNFDAEVSQDVNWAGTVPPGTGTQSAGGSANSIAFTINGRNYAAFGPPGTWFTWIRVGRNLSMFLNGALHNNSAQRPYIIVAALPQNLEKTGKTRAQLVAQFKQYAFKRPGNIGDPGSPTQVWGTKFQPALTPTAPGSFLLAGTVTGTFTYNLVNVGTGGAASDNTTLFALFPHQQANLQQVLGTTDASVYNSNQKYTGSKGLATSQTEHGNPGFSDGPYNGQMRLAQGTGFVLQYTLPPLYEAALPLKFFQADKTRLQQCLDWDWNIAWGQGRVSGNDSYGWGKLLSSVANNYQIAQSLSYDGGAAVGGITNLGNYLGDSLKQWFNANSGSSTYFAYDPNWNTMFPFPPGVSSDGFGVIAFLNDMHFHYGYFIRAAAVYAQYNPGFITDYGKMVEHLIRSIAADYNDQPNGDPDNAVYPPYRFFDPYAGSSSAAGAQQYGDGMNQESSSEGVNAWYGMLLWAKVTNNNTMLARAAYMYASETDAARRYVFCEDAVTNSRFALASNTFSNLYDDSNQYTIFFTATPGIFPRESTHIINWLPFGGGALYLNQNKAYPGLNYTALKNQAPGGDTYANYIDLIWMYRVFSNAQEAQTKADAIISACLPGNPPPANSLDNGNSLAMLYKWVKTLPNNLGRGRTVGKMLLLLLE